MMIVLYGINNLGKTTQAKLLVERFEQSGLKAEYLKYPIYDLEPSGPLLNDYLRHANPYALSPREAQLIYAMNRTQFEPALQAKLSAGTHIIAEDYTGTGLAWGAGAGVDPEFLKQINLHLLKEDTAFLFHGDRFAAATEDNHKHETNPALLTRVAEAHERLGRECNWVPVDANQSIDTIHEFLWQTILPRLS